MSDETSEEAIVSTSSSAFARHPALLGRLWGQAQIKGLQNFRGGGFYTIKEIVDDHTAVRFGSTKHYSILQVFRFEKPTAAERSGVACFLSSESLRSFRTYL